MILALTALHNFTRNHSFENEYKQETLALAEDSLDNMELLTAAEQRTEDWEMKALSGKIATDMWNDYCTYTGRML